MKDEMKHLWGNEEVMEVMEVREVREVEESLKARRCALN
jgi:hypothetical protein